MLVNVESSLRSSRGKPLHSKVSNNGESPFRRRESGSEGKTGLNVWKLREQNTLLHIKKRKSFFPGLIFQNPADFPPYTTLMISYRKKNGNTTRIYVFTSSYSSQKERFPHMINDQSISIYKLSPRDTLRRSW